MDESRDCSAETGGRNLACFIEVTQDHPSTRLHSQASLVSARPLTKLFMLAIRSDSKNSFIVKPPVPA